MVAVAGAAEVIEPLGIEPCRAAATAAKAAGEGAEIVIEGPVFLAQDDDMLDRRRCRPVCQVGAAQRRCLPVQAENTPQTGKPEAQPARDRRCPRQQSPARQHAMRRQAAAQSSPTRMRQNWRRRSFHAEYPMVASAGKHPITLRFHDGFISSRTLQILELADAAGLPASGAA